MQVCNLGYRMYSVIIMSIITHQGKKPSSSSAVHVNPYFSQCDLDSLCHTQEDIIILPRLPPRLACFIWSFAKAPLQNVEDIIGFSIQRIWRGGRVFFLEFLS